MDFGVPVYCNLGNVGAELNAGCWQAAALGAW
jgi:hypothetical protein